MVECILSAPLPLMQDMSRVIPALETSFRLGLSYYPMALSGCKALKRVFNKVPILKNRLPEVLPLLTPYLEIQGDVQVENVLTDLCYP